MDKVVRLLAILVGYVSMLAFGLFLWRGSLGVTDLGLAPWAVLTWDSVLGLVFFVQHSGMIRRSFREWLEPIVPRAYQGALYTIASGVGLLLVVSLWQAWADPLLELRGVWRWAARAVFVLSLGGMAWAARALGHFDAFGLDPLREVARDRPVADGGLVIRGPYRWVRHPLYSFMLLLIWSCPDVTPDRLLFNGTWTVWIVVATAWEERDLVAEFGDAYRDYQRSVPMLVPRRIGPASRPAPPRGRR